MSIPKTLADRMTIMTADLPTCHRCGKPEADHNQSIAWGCPGEPLDAQMRPARVVVGGATEDATARMDAIHEEARRTDTVPIATESVEWARLRPLAELPAAIEEARSARPRFVPGQPVEVTLRWSERGRRGEVKQREQVRLGVVHQVSTGTAVHVAVEVPGDGIVSVAIEDVRDAMGEVPR